MKKSMLAFASCALVAGAVMAAAVEGNNTAVVIQKEPVVSTTLYQFLIVPVKPFDITNSANASTAIPLNELLPPAGYEAGTRVYSATDASKLYTVAWYNPTTGEFPMVAQDTDTSTFTLVWASSGPKLVGDDVTFSTGDILWLQTASKPTDPTVFCGELSADKVIVDDENNTGMIPFGNATSEAVRYDNGLTFTSGKPVAKGDAIYVLEADTTEYTRYVYQTVHSSVGGDGTTLCWTKKNPNSSWMIPLAESDVMPAGAAAYYKRK